MNQQSIVGLKELSTNMLLDPDIGGCRKRCPWPQSKPQ